MSKTVQTIYASDFNIFPECDITVELSKLLSHLRETDGEKTVVFKKGTYYIDSEKCEKHKLFVTNTMGDSELLPSEESHTNAVAMYFGGVDNLIFDGGNSVFVIDGKVTNAVIDECENVTVKNLEIRHLHPDMHEMKVIRKGRFSVDFETDRDSEYEISDGKLYFFGKDYRVCANDNKKATWIGLINADTPNTVRRVRHPLFSALKTEKNENGIRVYYPNTRRFTLGDSFYLFDVRRRFVGIFINNSKNIKLENIKQRFNYSLAAVAQCTENIEIENVEFAAENGGARKMASVADFIQLCMCKGKVTVKNSLFCGAGDDCLNVHGVHFKITNIEKNRLTLRFMHPQTHGFNPIGAGDTVAFINPDTLLETGRAIVKDSHLLNEYEIILTVDNTGGAMTGCALEDVSACPELEFTGNTVSRIITRGLLVTTRGKVTIENNRFISTAMSGILLSDDAKSWYESGMCQNVTIKGNTFDYCGQTPILIKPENRIYKGAVHKNITISDNIFNRYEGVCISAESTDNIEISGNSFSDGKVKLKNCNFVNCDTKFD